MGGIGNRVLPVVRIWLAYYFCYDEIVHSLDMRKPRFSKKTIAEAIKGSNGLISTIAQRLDIKRSTVREYLKRYPELDQLIQEESESLLDYAESKLYKKISEGEAWAIKFYLSSKGKMRGYSNQDAPIPPPASENMQAVIIVKDMTKGGKESEITLT